MVSQRSANKRRTVKSSRRNGTSKRINAASARQNGAGSASKSASRNGTKSALRKGTSDGLGSAYIEGLTTPPGEHFFRNLSRCLAVAVDARFGFVSEVGEESGTLHLLAIWTGDDFGECITYPIEGTPCERVLGKNLVTIQKGVQKEYPEDLWLAEIGAESYMAVPLLGSDGRPIGHLGVIHDSPLATSEESVAVLHAFAARAAGELQRDIRQRQARQRSDRVEAIVNKAAVGVIQIDSEGKIVFANPNVERLFGYKRDELLGQPIELLVPGRQRKRHKQDRNHFLRNPHDRPMGPDLEIVGRRKDGSVIPVTIGLSSDGRGAVAIISDATKQIEAVAVLKQRHTRLEAVVDALPELTFVLDKNGVYRDFVSADGINPFVSPDKFLGKCMTDVLPKEVAEPAIACIKRALETNEVQRLRYTLDTPDSRHPYEGRFVRFDGEHVILFVRDLVAEQRLIKDGNRVVAGAVGADEVQRRMEWRNPYGLSYREFSVLHLLKGGTTDKEIAEDLGISVFTVNKHVSNILTKMNAASRTEATIRALQEGLID